LSATANYINELDSAIADNEAHAFVKVLTQPGKDKILGITIVGEHAGDLIAEFILAMKHNLGLNKVLGTIHISNHGGGEQICSRSMETQSRPQKIAGMGRALSCLAQKLITRSSSLLNHKRYCLLRRMRVI
jgi:hypothetical protein